MKSTCLLLLASLLVYNLAVCGGQGFPAEEDAEHGATIDDIILQRAETLLLRSILRKLQDADARNEGSSSPTEWVTKRQHPGKRYMEDLEKRQHPGRREEDDEDDIDDDDDDAYYEVQKRQHPGKRDTEAHWFTELQKRQHPGKRLVLVHSKRQHPGKRQDLGGEGFDDLGDDDGGDLSELEKRQHPGKRFWDNSNPDLGSNSPCDVLDPTSCSKASLLLDFLDNITKSHAEEKRQHPGKRSAPQEEE